MSHHTLPVDRIRDEYREMPGLRLTSAQVRRLWHLDPAACDAVLQALLEEGFLARTPDGAFVIQPSAGRRAAMTPAIRHRA